MPNGRNNRVEVVWLFVRSARTPDNQQKKEKQERQKGKI
jgi:hypothetical protein